MSLDEACQLVWNYLNNKIENYCSISRKNISVLLSAGWDSRLIASFLSKYHKLHTTYTTEQGGIKWRKYVIEKKIAKEVSKFLDVKNQYINPMVNTEFYEPAKIIDYNTTFHKWSISFAETLPYGENIFAMGFCGGTLLRNSNTSKNLQKCVEDGNKEKAVQLLLSEYISGGFSTINYPNLENWKHVLNPKFISDSILALKKTLVNEINLINSDNFVTMFNIMNRQRRCINWLPLTIIGRKGAVIRPFCDPEFVNIALAIPTKFKQNHSLYKCLLEKTKQGLSKIPSSNAKDKKELKPYLKLMYSKYQDLFLLLFNFLPKNFRWKFWKLFSILGYLHPQVRFIVNETIKNPPIIVMHFLTLELRNAIKKQNKRNF